jgi:hypothetical protein
MAMRIETVLQKSLSFSTYSLVQGVQKVTQPMEKCNIKFILLLLLLLLLCLFLTISAENVHHYALHIDAHDESC